MSYCNHDFLECFLFSKLNVPITLSLNGIVGIKLSENYELVDIHSLDLDWIVYIGSILKHFRER